MQQRVEEHFCRDHLLTHCGPVVDADASRLHLAIAERAAVIAVCLALQTLAVVGMHLRSVSDDQVAMREPRESVEFIEQKLSEPLAVNRVLGGVEDAERESSGDWAGLHWQPCRTLTAAVGGIRSSTEHLLREYTAGPEPAARTVL